MNKKKRKAPSPEGKSLPKDKVVQESPFHDAELKLIPASDRAVDFQPIKSLAVGDIVKLKKMYVGFYNYPREQDVVQVHRVILNPVNTNQVGAFTKLMDFTALFYSSENDALLEYEFDSRMFERVEPGYKENSKGENT